MEIAQHLIQAGHEAAEISRNVDDDTPLIVAARHGHTEVGKLLIREFPRCIQYTNKAGLDALAIAAQHPESTGLVPILLNNEHYPASVDVRDQDGNTPLHHASASGSLKALRILLASGADPIAKNNYDWTPLAYSQTVAAEVYFRNLVAEFERRRVEGLKQDEETKRQRAAGMRVVVGEDEEGGPSGGMQRRVPPVELNTPIDEEENIADALKRHWSPQHSRRPVTPLHEWDSRPTHSRTRSGTDD